MAQHSSSKSFEVTIESDLFFSHLGNIRKKCGGYFDGQCDFVLNVFD